MIYLTKEDWSNIILPKISNEESFKQMFLDFYKINNAFNVFTRKIYTKQSVQNYVFIAAEIIFHKYAVCSKFYYNEYSPEELYILLGACIYIGQRAINILNIKIDNISFFIKQLINKKNQNQTKKVDIKDLNKKIIQKEYDILTSIGFNIEIDSPFFFFNKLKNHISKFELNSANFITLLNYLIKDSFILPLSLYYTPNIITISCVQTLREKYNLNFIDIKEIISLSEYSIDDTEIQQCTLLIKKIEAAINEKKNQNNNNNVVKEEKMKIKESIDENRSSDTASITKAIPYIKMNVD